MDARTHGRTHARTHTSTQASTKIEKKLHMHANYSMSNTHEHKSAGDGGGVVGQAVVESGKGKQRMSEFHYFPSYLCV